MGGPSSGHESGLITALHRDSKFQRSSPVPAKTFDETRGASVEMNSYNHLN
jgi:hypothetical protein